MNDDEAAKTALDLVSDLPRALRWLDVPPHLVQDIVQETTVSLFDELRTGRLDLATVSNPRSYAFTKAGWFWWRERRSAIRRVRREDRWARRNDEVTARLASSVAVNVDVQRALERLTDRQRAVVLLCRGMDLAINQAAALLDVSPGTVRSHLERAERRLLALLSDEERRGS